MPLPGVWRMLLRVPLRASSPSCVKFFPLLRFRGPIAHFAATAVMSGAFSTGAGSKGAVSEFAAGDDGGWLTEANMNSQVRAAQYAVRGEIVLRAAEHAHALAAAKSAGVPSPLPFEHITHCNIGNPHELGQRALTFNRAVLALVDCPALASDARAAAIFPPDVLERARAYGVMLPGGTGAYTNSQGLEGVRGEVAAYITARDAPSPPARASDIFLTDGASPAVQMVLRSLLCGPRDAVLIPTPQYPLYSASLALYGGAALPYYLDEAAGWTLAPAELERAHAEGVAAGLRVRGIAVINPGNPTGSCLSRDDVRGVLAFAARHRLVVLADEVYQNNVWSAARAFHSFRSVAIEMGLVDPTRTAVNTGVQLASFHSTSKGFTGECGRRGGYVELLGFDPAVRAELYKLASISLCANTSGQVMVGLMTNPPRPGDASHALYAAERDGILASLRRRATKLAAALNALEGVSCQEPEGALYVFPTITVPPRAVEAAAAAGKAPDAFYCLRLLDATGVVVVPGSGFGQAPGTQHFRSTILPSEADLDRVIAAFTAFHEKFMAEWK